MEDAALDIFDAARAAVLGQDTGDLRACADRQVAPQEAGPEIGPRRAVPPAAPLRGLQGSDAELRRAVDVWVERMARLLRCGDKGFRKRMRGAHVGNAQRPFAAAPVVATAGVALQPLEVGKHAVIVPACRAGGSPGIVVRPIAAQKNHAVDRGATAEHAAGRPGLPASLAGGVRFGLVGPGVVRIADRFFLAGRHAEDRRPIPAAGFQQQHAARAVRGQPVGDYRSRGAGANDDNVSGLRRHHLSLDVFCVGA